MEIPESKKKVELNKVKIKMTVKKIVYKDRNWMNA